MARGALLLLVVLAGCAGEEFAVDVRAAEVLGCEELPLARGGLQSVGIEVVREVASGLEQVADLGSCEPIERTRRVVALLEPFRESGVIVAGVPAETRTILRIVGYQSDSCLRDSERVCGITCPPVRAGEIPPDGVRANFVCDGLQEQTHRRYAGCLNLEQLSEEDRANICSYAE